jgi:hypothetical protein
LSSIRDNIARIRCKNNITFKVNNIDLLEILIKTLKGENFLIYDNKNISKRILIYSTYENLIHLENSPIWVADGTF